ncbi:hypothetical protein C8Q79DRAFT_120745 [Trametes meyenii]|nr:hypothetical protein C8Q79DRAFT_120745 [Trametes meyenii]
MSHTTHRARTCPPSPLPPAFAPALAREDVAQHTHTHTSYPGPGSPRRLPRSSAPSSSTASPAPRTSPLATRTPPADLPMKPRNGTQGRTSVRAPTLFPYPFPFPFPTPTPSRICAPSQLPDAIIARPRPRPRLHCLLIGISAAAAGAGLLVIVCGRGDGMRVARGVWRLVSRGVGSGRVGWEAGQGGAGDLGSSSWGKGAGWGRGSEKLAGWAGLGKRRGAGSGSPGLWRSMARVHVRGCGRGRGRARCAGFCLCPAVVVVVHISGSLAFPSWCVTRINRI